jgi:hypothetical protein
MFLLTALAVFALAGEPEQVELQIDARVATEVHIDGLPLAKLFVPGVFTAQTTVGSHTLKAYMYGNPHEITLIVAPTGGHVVIDGESIINHATTVAPVFTGLTPVEFRSTGREGVQLRLGQERHAISPGHSLTLELHGGPHPLSIRNERGTVIWASGTLNVDGPDAVLIRLEEGHGLDVGTGASFTLGGG